MFLVRVSPYRLLIINEYYFFIPIGFIGLTIYHRWSTNRAQRREAEKNAKGFLKKLQLLKMMHIMNNNILSALLVRGGESKFVEILEEVFIELQFENIVVGRGVRYINNERFRRIILSAFKSKLTRNGIIFITESALKYLVKYYGMGELQPNLHFPVQQLISVTDIYQTLRKLSTTAFMMAGGYNLLFAATLGASIPGIGACIIGLILGNINLEQKTIDTTIILIRKFSEITRRVPTMDDVVSINLQDGCLLNSIPKILPIQCSLPTEQLFNPICQKSTVENVATIINDLMLNEENVVTLKDVTQMDLNFVDVFEIKPQAQCILEAAEEVIEVF
jgi:hypothetical protein